MMRFLRICAAVVLLCISAISPSYVLAQDQPAPTVSVPTQTTGTTITTTAPVSNDTTISVGTIAGQVLTWVLAAFAVPIGGFIVQLLYKLAAKAGVTLDDARRERLQEIVENGLHLAAASVSKDLNGKIPLAVKSQVLAQVVAYTQMHGADTLKALGLEPQGILAVDAIKARTEKALADPTVPVTIAPSTTAPLPSRPL